MHDIAFSECKNEQQFKVKYVNKVLRKQYPAVFCIETEETVAGFPDVLCLQKDHKAVFYEFKFSNSQGKIKFQPTQPAFYRQHSDLDIWIVALNNKTKEAVVFPVWDISPKKGERRFYMNEKAEVQL